MTEPQPNQGFSLFGRIFTLLFGLVFGGIGALFLSVVVYSAWQDLQPFFWSQAECKILTSEFKRVDGNTEPHVTYEYLVSGKTYRGNVLIPDAPMNRSAALKKYSSLGGQIKGFQVGMQVPCYVDTTSPDRAVIERRAPWYALFAPLPLIFVLIGIACIFSAFGSGTIAPRAVSAKASRKKLIASKQRIPTPDTASWSPSASVASQATFRSSKSRWTKAVAIAIITIFWNGMVAIPFFVASGSFAFLAYLFLVPFALVGLVLILVAVNCVLALANPALEVRLQLPLKIAENSSVQWFLQGKVERVEELVFTLEGKEEVTYRRGTSTSFDRRIFQTIEVARLTRNDLRRKNGVATIRMPEITAPSFVAPNNKISWYLRIRGVVPRWPDIDDSYAVQVVLKNL